MCQVCQAMANTSAAVSGIADGCPEATLDSGTYRNDDVISIYFVGAGQDANAADEINDPSGSDEIVSEGWTTFEENRVIAALTAIENYIDVTFSIEPSNPNADFQLVLDNGAEFGSSGFLGYFYQPAFAGDDSAVMGAFNSNGFGWDTSGGLEEGGLGFSTIIHEILHGLGLDHPHDGDNILPGLDPSSPNYPFGYYGDFDLNQEVYTIMSYNDGWFGAPSSDSSGHAATPMALDIAILQDLYGANTSYNTGDNTYEIGDEAWVGIWDAGGNDTISYSGAEDITIDLRAATLQYAEGGGGFISTAQGLAGGYTIANGVVIENASGGSGDDLLIGNDADNEVSGNGGNDDIYGGAGDDDLDGGAGNDEIDGNSGADQINAASGTNTIFGSSGFDTLQGGSGVDTIFGGSGNDTIEGNGSNDVLFGGRGDDAIDGGAGNDQIIGGLGADDLTGGAGADDFVFEFASDSLAGVGNRDTITDFQVGVDDIDLSNIGGLSFTDDITLTINNGTIVQIDTNGDDVVDMEIFIDDVTGLTASDFLL